MPSHSAPVLDNENPQASRGSKVILAQPRKNMNPIDTYACPDSVPLLASSFNPSTSVRIMKRSQTSTLTPVSDSNATSSSLKAPETSCDMTEKTLEQRELEYEEARARIFYDNASSVVESPTLPFPAVSYCHSVFAPDPYSNYFSVQAAMMSAPNPNQVSMDSPSYFNSCAPQPSTTIMSQFSAPNFGQFNFPMVAANPFNVNERMQTPGFYSNCLQSLTSFS